jgi:hypothetical protein
MDLGNSLDVESSLPITARLPLLCMYGTVAAVSAYNACRVLKGDGIFASRARVMSGGVSVCQYAGNAKGRE